MHSANFEIIRPTVKKLSFEGMQTDVIAFKTRMKIDGASDMYDLIVSAELIELLTSEYKDETIAMLAAAHVQYA